MEIADILVPERIHCKDELSSKKGVLEALSHLLADGLIRVNSQDVFEGLLARERLGSTGLGHGVALPHARIKNCTEAVGAYVHTAVGIDFDALDSEPVDVFFALLVPEDSTEDHLQTLAKLAQRFSDAELLERLRTSSEASQVLDILTE